jgi:hypothetical protein
VCEEFVCRKLWPKMIKENRKHDDNLSNKWLLWNIQL